MTRRTLVRKNKSKKGRFGLRRKGFYISLTFTWEERISKPVASFLQDWVNVLLADEPPEIDFGLCLVDGAMLYTNLIPKSCSFSNLSTESPIEDHELTYTIEFTGCPGGEITNGIHSIKYNADWRYSYRSNGDDRCVL
jgi:hypothetical protein